MLIDTRFTQGLHHQLFVQGRPSLAPTDPKLESLRLDELGPEVRARVQRVAPICEVLYLTMLADGRAADVEKDTLRGAMLGLTGDALDAALLDALLTQFDRAIEVETLAGRLHFVAAQLSADRDDAEVALMLAGAIVLADGRIDPGESDLIQELCESLGISPKRADQLFAGGA